MPREIVLGASGYVRRWTVEGWQVKTPVGEPLNKASISCQILYEIRSASGAEHTARVSFTIEGAQMAAFLNNVETIKAQLVTGGANVPVATAKAWRRALYEAAPVVVIPAEAATTDD